MDGIQFAPNAQRTKSSNGLSQGHTTRIYRHVNHIHIPKFTQLTFAQPSNSGFTAGETLAGRTDVADTLFGNKGLAATPCANIRGALDVTGRT